MGQSKAYAEDVWKTLSQYSHEAHQKLEKDAKDAIEKALSEVQEAQQARQKNQQTLNALQSQWQVLSHDYEMLTTQLSQTQKHLLRAEEANKALEKHSKKLKENAIQQITYLKDQDEKKSSFI